METTTTYAPGDRYQLDFGPCSVTKGFAQMDTTSDAYYYGIWVNPTERTTVTYAEGDLIVSTTGDDAEFVDHVKALAEWHRQNDDGFKGIDCGLDPQIEAAFVAYGLADMLH